jgi:hypothetical protein
VETVPSGFEENLDKFGLGPFEYAVQTGTNYPWRLQLTIATKKALDVYENLVVFALILVH